MHSVILNKKSSEFQCMDIKIFKIYICRIGFRKGLLLSITELIDFQFTCNPLYNQKIHHIHGVEFFLLSGSYKIFLRICSNRVKVAYFPIVVNKAVIRPQ